MKKVKLNKKNILIAVGILLLIILLIIFLISKTRHKKKTEPKSNNKKVEEKVEQPKEKVDIIDVNSKTRPLAISVNNTPVAVKVQTGLNKAYIVYELPTEGATSRLLALYKNVENTKVGTIRSARHNFIDFALESDAIFVSYGWSHYAEDDLKKGLINYIQGIVGEGGMFRENPEKLASEHTAYLQTDKINDAISKKGYNKESDKTILLNYNSGDVDLSKKEGVMDAKNITIPYGNIVTKFKYNDETKMYNRIVNNTVTTDHETKEEFTTKNIIVQRLTYKMCSDNYYWDLNTVSSGEGYYITNGKAVPIKWSKSSRNDKTKYTYLDGKEIEVSDGRTYIEVQVTNKKTTIE
jgi:hypothetical protein